MKIESPNLRSAVKSAAVASAIMLISGLGYRVLADRLQAPGNTAPLSPEQLRQLPLQIGDWTGREVPLDEAIVEATDTDAHVNRSYSRSSAPGSVSLYIASGVKARDLMPHRPEVCYTSAGWTLVERLSLKLPLSDAAILPCNIMQFSRGMLNSGRLALLDYYIVDGQYCGDVSELRSRAWRGQGTVRYVAQVQIAAAVPSNMPANSAIGTIRTFAVESASSITALFQDAREDGQLNEDRVDPNLASGVSGQ